MALTIYMGRAGTGKSRACYERIKELLREDPGTPIILLVPDSASYTVERELASSMEHKGFTSVRVVGISRLGYQVFQAAGIQRNALLSDVSENIIIRSILKKRENELTIFRRAAGQPKFSDTLKTLFTEMKAFRIEPKDLQAGTEQVNSIVLRKKLSDLALLSEDYNRILTERFGVAEDTMEQLIRLVPTSPIAKEAYVFIDGFHWFTPHQLQLIQALIDNSKASVVTITLPYEDKEKYARKGTLFNRSWETYQELLELYGTDIEVRNFAENHRFTEDSLQKLEKEFFTTPMVIKKENQEISIWQGANRQREADRICRQILAMMQGHNRRWKDFAIMLREAETYGDVLEKTLEEYEIPFFTDRRHPMVTHPLAELTEGIFAIAKSRFGHDALFRVLKTDLVPLPREDVDRLENYCLEFGIGENGWLREAPWTPWGKRTMEIDPLTAEDIVVEDNFPTISAVENTVDYTDETANETAEEKRLRLVNISKDVVHNLFRPFYDFAGKAHTGREWCEAIFTLFNTLKVPATLSQWTRDARDGQNVQETAAHEQMYKHIIALLEDITLACGEELLTLEEMSLVISEGLESVTYSLVPPTLDHVTVTTVERSYTTEFPIVFVPGLNDGIFPQRMGDEGLLRDTEREELRKGGVSLAAGALVQAFNENFLFYLACTRAKEKLFLSYSGNDAAGAGLEPSLPIRRLEQGHYSAKTVMLPLDIPTGLEDDYIWRPRQSLSLLSQQLYPLTKGEPIDGFWWELYEWGRSGEDNQLLRRAVAGVNARNTVPVVEPDIVQSLLLHNRTMTGSVTRLEKYQQCPFSFYAQYALKLEARRVRQFSSPEIGTFLHENLRKIGEYLLAENRQWRDLDPVEGAALCASMAEETARELSEGILNESAYYLNLRERLEKTLQRTVGRLTEWSERSSFNTVAVEQDFGRTAEGWNPVYIPIGKDKKTGETLSFRVQGQIDRLDMLSVEDTQYALVVDYKSGKAEVSGQDVYYGLKLQLLTYLLAVEKAGATRTEPAALVYTYVKNPQLSVSMPLDEESAKERKLADSSVNNSGYYTADKGILEELDSDFAGGGGSSFVPIKTKNDGDFTAAAAKVVKSAAQFGVLTEYTEQVLAKAGEHILAGHFPISPYYLKNRVPCKYCPFKAVCRFEPTGGDTKYRYLETLNEAQSLEKMQKGGTVYEVDKRTTGRD